MLFMPFQILGIWLRGLIALLVLGLGAGLLYEWYDNRTIFVRVPFTLEEVALVEPDADAAAAATNRHFAIRRIDWQFGFNRETAYLLGGLALVLGSLGGGRLLGGSLWRRRGQDEPHEMRRGVVQRLHRPDGSVLHAEIYGPEDAMPVVLTHGWGLDSNEWYYVRKELGDRYRLIAWDLPGLGHSTGPKNKDWSLEKLAGDLEAVLSLAGPRPAVLVGHSIGGMINLTFCRLFPETLARRVAGMVVAHSTYTNPVRTTQWPGLYSAIQKPVLEPLCYLMIWLSPVVWVMNWLSYLNGSAHRSTERSSFSGHETKGQLDFLTKYYVKAWPGVVARGMLGMFRYDATNVLPTIPVPTLVVTGDGDKTCKPEASVEMSRAIPRATLVSLKPARHCGLFEQHDQFAAELQRFVATCAAGDAARRTVA